MKFFNMVRFTKEGKGVDPNTPPKRAFFRFWSLFFSKFYKLVRLNLLFLLFNLVAIILLYLSTFFPAYAYLFLSSKGNLDSAFMGNYQYVQTFIVIFFTSLPFFTVGPAQAGFTYILKSFVKGDPIFLWSDFIEKAKQNLKLSIQVCVLDLFIGIIMMTDVAVYMALTTNPIPLLASIPPIFLIIAVVVVAFAGCFYMIMHLYMYPMMVTFNVTFKQLMRNSAILALIKWLPNLGIILLEAVLVFLNLYVIKGAVSPITAGIFYIFITPAFYGLLNNFYVYPNFKKYMIKDEPEDNTDK